MGQTHYYYAIIRKAAERVFDLTWDQFLAQILDGASGAINGRTSEAISLSALVDSTSDESRRLRNRAILRWSIRETVPTKAAPVISASSVASFESALGKRSFIRANVDAERLEDDLDALNICAISAFLSGEHRRPHALVRVHDT